MTHKNSKLQKFRFNWVRERQNVKKKGNTKQKKKTSFFEVLFFTLCCIQKLIFFFFMNERLCQNNVLRIYALLIVITVNMTKNVILLPFLFRILSEADINLDNSF